ncbi:putative permease [Burkholderiales bacterium JOSHI_001]|nr:putative permease [Burkholderiales bacterium JOSHI_001]
MRRAGESDRAAWTAPAVTASATLLGTALVLAGLYLGRALWIPLALAVLLAFALHPAVRRLRRLGLPRGAAAAGVLLAAGALFVLLGWAVAWQLEALAKDLPQYREHLLDKLQTLPGLGGLGSAAGAQPGALAGASAPAADNTALPWSALPDQLAPLWHGLSLLLAPLTTGAAVLVFLVLVLLDPGDLRDRLLRLVGDQLHRNTDALDDLGRRVSGYLGMQLLANAAYGVPLALGLAWIGIPGALLWGLLAALLRFVPYLGPLVASAFPVALSLAVAPGWGLLGQTLALIVVLEGLANQVLEPWLTGASTGLSALALIVAAMFWSALWGPLGLVLSTPLTVCLLVAGRHVPALGFLEVLLGKAPALDAPTRLHQRLLAGDADDAVEVASEHASPETLQAFYNDTAIAALRLASASHIGESTALHRHRVVTGMGRVIEELRELVPPVAHGPPQVACLAGRWELDALAADMAAHALAVAGTPCLHLPHGAPSSDWMARLDIRSAQVVCLSYFSPQPVEHAQLFSRRLVQRWPGLQVVLALWNLPSGRIDDIVARQPSLLPDVVCCVTSMNELVAQVQALRGHTGRDPWLPAPRPDDDTARVAALQGSGLMQPSWQPLFDRLARRAADVFNMPMALVSLVDEDWQLTHGDAHRRGRAPARPPQRGVARPLSLCGHAIAQPGRTLVVPDVLRDPRFANNPVLAQQGIRFYAGATLRDAQGHALGTVCVLDRRPRNLSPADLALLEAMADEVMRQVQPA